MRYLSVCAGIEAATVAWHPLGWEAAAFSEIEAFPRAVLAHHYPEVPLHGDFTTIGADDYGAIDLLVGGTPCQSFSIAGLRGGLADDRGNLALEFLRLADRKRPRWVVWENVPGVFSSLSHDAPDLCPPAIDLDAGDGPEDGEEVVVEDSYDADESHAFSCFLAGLSELGYGVAYRVLDAQYAGVPQRRRRVFAVGYLGDWRRAAAVLFERHSLSGHSAPRPEAGQGTAIGALAGTSPGGGWRVGADEAAAGQLVTGTLNANGKAAGSATQQDAENGMLVAAFGGNNTSGPIDVSTALTSHGGLHGGLHGRQDFASETFVTSPVPFDTTQVTSAANYSNPKMGDPCHPLARGQHAPAIAFSIMPMNSSRDYKARETDVAQPIMAGGPVGGNQGGDFIAQVSAVRRLTPRECEGLQGFPDDYTLIPVRGKPAADGPRYKALGNSMAVPVMRWIGERIAAADAISQESQAV